MSSPVVPAESTDHLLALFRDLDAGVGKRIEKGIEQNRMGSARLHFVDAAGEPVKGVRLEVRQLRHDFLFGANIFSLGGFETEEKNDAYERAFLGVFNSAVVPFYWSDLEPKRGQPRFLTDSVRIPRRPPPDEVLAFCERHRVVPKGHCLVWHQWLPAWLPADCNEVSRLSTERIRAIAHRYGRRIPLWDVVNEPMEKFIFPDVAVLSEDYVAEAFQEAADAFPPEAKLILNEATTFSWREFHGGTTGLHLLVRNLLLRGRKIDVIGLQYHLFFYDEKGLTKSVGDLAKNRDTYLNPQRLLDILDLHARPGRPIHISEVTLPTYPDFEDAERLQTGLLRELYRLWFSHPAVEAIYWWNLADGTAHGAEAGLRGGLLRPDLTRKPAYEALRRLVCEEWRTSFTVRANETHAFRGFYGEYEIVTEHEGHRASHRVGLHRGAPSEFRLQVVPGITREAEREAVVAKPFLSPPLPA